MNKILDILLETLKTVFFICLVVEQLKKCGGELEIPHEGKYIYILKEKKNHLYSMVCRTVPHINLLH